MSSIARLLPSAAATTVTDPSAVGAALQLADLSNSLR
jgi:hypothetical protein